MADSTYPATVFETGSPHNTRDSIQAANAAIQYWVTFAFLTVFESAVSASYWFREYPELPHTTRH